MQAAQISRNRLLCWLLPLPAAVEGRELDNEQKQGAALCSTCLTVLSKVRSVAAYAHDAC